MLKEYMNLHKIDIGNSQLFWGTKAFHFFFETLQKWEKVFLLVDENTNQYCLPILEKDQNSFFDTKIIIPSGELNKNIITTQEIWKVLVEENANRKSIIINLGGGTITDIGGFAASTFMRGIPFVHIPTTLLSMIDAALGGKTGIDFEHYKNYIGTFHFPESIFIFPDFLSSLPPKQILSGFAELIKHAIVADANLWDKIKSLQSVTINTITTLLIQSLKVKVNIVNQDFKELGKRKILNFGHTVGHAIESYALKSKNNFLHGEAVAIGILVESHISKELGYLSPFEFTQIQKLIQQLYKIPRFNQSELNTILDLMRYDKKNEDGRIIFSLPDKIGHCLINQHIDPIKIQNSLSTFLTK
jgi:3-dehydroquinate synthase